MLKKLLDLQEQAIPISLKSIYNCVKTGYSVILELKEPGYFGNPFPIELETYQKHYELTSGDISIGNGRDLEYDNKYVLVYGYCFTKNILLAYGQLGNKYEITQEEYLDKLMISEKSLDLNITQL